MTAESKAPSPTSPPLHKHAGCHHRGFEQYVDLSCHRSLTADVDAGYHPEFKTLARSVTVTLQNGEGEPLKFRTSKFLLMEVSSFFRDLFSLERKDKAPIELPRATSDGLAFVLGLLHAGLDPSRSPPEWPSTTVLDNIIVIADVYDLNTARLKLYTVPAPSPQQRLERFALVAATGGNFRVAAQAAAALDPTILNDWTRITLSKFPQAPVTLLEFRLLWNVAINQLKDDRPQFHSCKTFSNCRTTWIDAIASMEELCRSKEAWELKVYTVSRMTERTKNSCPPCREQIAASSEGRYARYLGQFFDTGKARDPGSSSLSVKP
jgi:hypothetical protein